MYVRRKVAHAPIDDVKHRNELVVFEVTHVEADEIRLDLLLNVTPYA